MNYQISLGSELEWLFYQLWLKTTAAPPRFMFSIPDTMFYRNDKPDTWYFTSKEGHILKKNKMNVNIKTFHL